MKAKFYLILGAMLLALACSKNKLKDEYASFIGAYQWRYTGAQKGSFLTIKTSTLYKHEAGYEAGFELNNKGEAIFFKNGAVISKNSYRINDKETNQYGGKDIIIKLKGTTTGMQIPDNTLKLHLSGDSVLTIDKFPFPAIDKMENYKPEYTSLSSNFIRK